MEMRLAILEKEKCNVGKWGLDFLLENQRNKESMDEGIRISRICEGSGNEAER